MRILIVEDERKVAEMVSRGLGAERYEVDIAENGETGWAMAHTYDYDLVILDLGLTEPSFFAEFAGETRAFPFLC